MREFKNLITISTAILLFSGCSPKSFHNEMIESTKKSLDKKDYRGIQQSYSNSLIDEIDIQKTYISVIDDKSLGDILKELEQIDGNLYFLKSSDILVPKSRIKISSFEDLNNYLNAVLDKTLIVEQNGQMYLVKVLNSSERKKRSIKSIPFNLEGQITVEELIRLITVESGYEVNIGSFIENRNDFQNSIVQISSRDLQDALNSLAQSKDVYVDIDYDKEAINISRYKDVVIELNIPLLDMSSSSQTSNRETEGGESKIENKSQIVLYEELDKMLKNIISTDKVSSYHIDKASGLIFLKSTKSIENAVRTLAKAYEASFAKEAIIEFERIEILLNKSMEFGILGADVKRIGEGTSWNIASIPTTGVLGFTTTNANRTLKMLADSKNNIGKMLNYSKNMLVLKNNIPTVQSITENMDYIEKIESTTSGGGTEALRITSEVTVNTLKEGTSITAMAKISRDKIFLNISPTIKKLIEFKVERVGITGGDSTNIQLPHYNDQTYNISKEINLGETSVVGSIIVHDNAKGYEGIVPLENFAIGGTDSKSYVRREIVYVITLKEIKGF